MPHYFYSPSPDFTTSFVSQSVTNNCCAPSCGGGAQEKSEGAHLKKFRPALRAGIVPPPLANCFRRHCPRPKGGRSPAAPKFLDLLLLLLSVESTLYAYMFLCAAIFGAIKKLIRKIEPTMVHFIVIKLAVIIRPIMLCWERRKSWRHCAEAVELYR